MGKIKTEATKRYIAIGSRGTAMAELSDEQVKQVKLNSENELSLGHRSDAQLIASRAGKWQDSLGYDARAYVSAKSFWLGTLETALAKGLVQKATATVEHKGKQIKVACYVKRGYDCAKEFAQFYATDCELGRIESATKKHGEKRRAGKAKNTLFVRDFEAVELVK